MTHTSMLLLRGIIGIVAGILAMSWPGLTLAILVTLFAVFVLFDGAANVFSGFKRDASGDLSWPTILQGLVGIGAGIATFIWPMAVTLVLLMAIATWAVITGLLEIIGAIRLRRVLRGEWLMALAGTLSVLFGIVLFAYPGLGALTLAWALGAYAAARGLLMVGLAITHRTHAVAA